MAIGFPVAPAIVEKLEHCRAGLPLIVEAVAQTLGEPARLLLTVGSETAISSVTRMSSVARSSRMVALGCLSASARQLFRDGFMRQPRLNAILQPDNRQLLLWANGSSRATAVSTRPLTQRLQQPVPAVAAFRVRPDQARGADHGGRSQLMRASVSSQRLTFPPRSGSDCPCRTARHWLGATVRQRRRRRGRRPRASDDSVRGQPA